VLSAVSVRAMTRNQIPGVPARFGLEFFKEGMAGYGWTIHGDKKTPSEDSLRSPETFSAAGAGGSFMWVDPSQELVGVYLSVVTREDANGQGIKNSDLFMNAAAAALTT
jgi:CubicO group peptidase (beta-lactamase class C family)